MLLIKLMLFPVDARISDAEITRSSVSSGSYRNTMYTNETSLTGFPHEIL